MGWNSAMIAPHFPAPAVQISQCGRAQTMVQILSTPQMTKLTDFVESIPGNVEEIQSARRPISSTVRQSIRTTRFKRAAAV